MSYRNPKIIVPPNYGEIFAKNMAYGANMVASALQPITSALAVQKRTKERMAASTAQYQQNIRNLVTSKSGNFETMFEEHLQKNADAWYENEKSYANGKIDAKEYNAFKNNLIQEVYDAAGASKNLNDVLTYINANKTLLSSRNDHEVFGLLNAIENPNESNFQITRNDKGETILKYNDSENNPVEFDYSKLQSIKTENILLRNDYTPNGDLGKKLKGLGTQAVSIAPQYLEVEEISRDLGNNKQRLTPVTRMKAGGIDALKNQARAINAASDIFTKQELETHFLDEMHGSGVEYETRIAQSAAIMAKNHNVADEQDLYKKLLTPFKPGQMVKLNDGTEKSVQAIAYDIAEEDLIVRSLKSTGLKPYFEGVTQLQSGPSKVKTVKPKTPSNASIEKYNELLELTGIVGGNINNGLESGILIPEAFEPGPAVNPEDKYKVNIESDEALAKIHEYLIDNLGMEILKSKKEDETFTNFGNENNPYYQLNLRKSTLGTKVEQGAKTEFKLTKDTTLFDLIAYRLNFSGVKTSGEKLQEIYENNNNNYFLFQQELANLFGIPVTSANPLGLNIE